LKIKAKYTLLAALLVSLLVLQSTPASASAPYESYNYNYWKEAVPSPAPYLPQRAITGRDLGIGDFQEPSDMYITDQGYVYIADSGNKRIVCLDPNWKLLRVLSTFDHQGKKDAFNNPSGVFAGRDGMLYVADTNNHRVVVISPEGKLKRIIQNPKSEVLPGDFKFVPLKVTADNANRVYVVAQGIYEGIMQFDEQGNFIGYVGTNKVQRNYADYFWRMISTKAQKAQMVLFIPTEFSNVDIDAKGFVYATNIDPGSQEPIKRLNPSGEDVLKRFGYFEVKGDIRYSTFGANSGPSKMVDIKVREGGMYSVVDSLRGRIFTYDDEGNLLYVFGAKGTQLGTFKTPVAIDRAGENLAVLDRGKSNIVLFEPTAFGNRVNKAVEQHYNGDDDKAVESWKEVLRLNSNYDIAYIGIGKSLLIQKRNEEAQEYFKLGMERKNYSVAYKRYRREVMKEYFGTFLTILVCGGLALLVWRMGKSWRRKRGERREAGLY
jgi:DNA-binding beta-propeller fold protein YncE